MSKNAHSGPSYRRRAPFRPLRESFLILCEGKSTEPQYFNAFRLSTATVRALPVTAGDAMAVVQSAIKRREAEIAKGKEYDQYWVVFDKDATPGGKFNEAIQLAESSGFHVAYSNQAFELWLLLHFDYISGPMDRRDYSPRLSAHLGFPYSKQTDTARLLFQALLGHQSRALENARRLYNSYTGKRRNPAAEESSTTVYKLVEELRRFL